MCGIAGLLAPGEPDEALRARATAMAGAMRHRGPDEQGVWSDPGTVALGHTRLSIIDLSVAGRQPMHSASGRYVITFNGEIYNFPALRDELQRGGTAFRGGSDTEVLLAAIDAWGVREAVTRCAGMFAFGLWDRERRRLTLARDRVGEKPLYFGRVGAALAFASELKALRVLPGWSNELDLEALAAFFRYGCIPAPRSIHVGIEKLLPGELVEFDETGFVRQRVRYWDAAEVASRARSQRLVGDDPSVVEELDARLRRSVARCMLADVPLGAFLSGGIDSSTIVALMQAQSRQAVRTFTIGFRAPGYDEAGLARTIARHLGTDHTELYVDPADALAVVPDLPAIYDEPFADSSQIPTFLVSRLARRHVTVALSGDAGDELFGGYNRHTWGARLWSRARPIGAGLRGMLGKALASVPGPTWDRAFAIAGRALPARARQFSAGDRIHKVARLVTARDEHDLYERMISHWREPVVLSAAARASAREWPLPDLDAATLPERMMLGDLRGFLPDDVLVKLDRASMAVSLESRVPFLDHELVEFAWRLPTGVKIRDGKGKWILRQVLGRYVPAELFERPKMGFAVPIDSWLRGPLRDWAETLLSREHLGRHGLLDATLITRYWTEHVTGRAQRQAELWDVLMFQAWYDSLRP
jgi:asparagine synthase (glutamine-hydrolysing)